MFTGIIQAQGSITALEQRGGDAVRVVIVSINNVELFTGFD